MTYFFDNNVSFRLVGMLRALGVDAVALREEHPASIDDVAFLRHLHGRRCVFVTADKKIQRCPAEAQALRESRATTLFFGPFWPKLTLSSCASSNTKGSVLSVRAARSMICR